ncbi:SCY kinase-related protein (incomplete catalytic triad) [Toxoplasma gondii ME49]|uniref:SCY kinase-related protein (Incomplete catalytic triad) n=1 Tax=Toxoplasma gondii (strain ATCC 50611 / Me49) TaxID=508771 RepID=S8FBA4_TOXGM|nr:SCY kinase-related protein (incomplete catalytic triad) [Toxoplasma gondii ME49]EPT32102.1 SCY kinase-related protein (incomplete catalytic triad) [Toxoplasma gondii ME49]|eukprot:XP_018638329.1 SCY kinase-related protein (incomplete catalytic triad) [Toxoplasma gondii ME49]
MGNPLLKLYSVDKEKAIDGGRFLRWTIYRGQQKDRSSSASSLVSLFCFDKKALTVSPFSSSPSLRSSLLSLLQQEAQLLQRLRHPQLLHLVEPLQDDKNSLVFCTRLVETTLREQLYEQCRPHSGGRGLSSSEAGPYSSAYTRESEDGGSSTRGKIVPLSLLEIKSGLLDLGEALQFLHADAQLVHLNVNPDSVFFTPKGQWRLGGLGFAQEIIGDGSAGKLVDCGFSFGAPSGSAQAQVSVVPPLYYSAPELAASHPGKCCRASDIFSLGLLMAEVLLGAGAGSEARLLKTNEWDVSAHQAQCQRLLPLRSTMFANSPYFSMPSAAASLPTLIALLSSMLSPDPSQRPSIEQFLQSPFFQDMNMRALRFLESLHEKDESQKIQFLKGFLPLLQQQEEFHHTNLLRNRVVGPLLDALAFPALYPFVLPNLFFVIKQLNDRAYFQSEVWPRIRPLLTAREIQIESVLLLMNELEYLMTQCSDTSIQQDLLPLTVKCMQIQEPRIQEAVLTRLPTVHQKFDYTVLRTSVLPRVLSVIQQATSSTVRVQGLAAVTAMASAFDRSTIVEQIVAVVQQTSAADKSGVVCGAVCTTLETLAKQVGLKTTTERLLHILLPLLMEEGLTATEFDQVYRTLTSILGKVETTRRKQFALQSEQASAVAAALPPSSTPSSSVGFQDTSAGALRSDSSTLGSQPLPFEALLMSPTAGDQNRDPQPPPPPPHPSAHATSSSSSLPSSSFPSSSFPSSSAFGRPPVVPSTDDPFLLAASERVVAASGRSLPTQSSSSSLDWMNSLDASSASRHVASASSGSKRTAPASASASSGFLFAATSLPAHPPESQCAVAPLPKLPEELFGSLTGSAGPDRAGAGNAISSGEAAGSHASGKAADAKASAATSASSRNTRLESSAQNATRTNQSRDTASSLEDILSSTFSSPSSLSNSPGLALGGVGVSPPTSREAQLRDAFAQLHPPSAAYGTALAPRADPFASLCPNPPPAGCPASLSPVANGIAASTKPGLGFPSDPFAGLAGPSVSSNVHHAGKPLFEQAGGIGSASSSKVDPFAQLGSFTM